MKRRIFCLLLLAGLLLSLSSCSALKNIKNTVKKWYQSVTSKPVNEKDYIQGDVTIPEDLSVRTLFLTVSSKNRPGTALSEVRNIVIHYVANPGTSAEANRNYFEHLSDPASNPSGTSASAHFIVGLQGEIVQCVPVNEVAYANYPRNDDTISIEVCHPNEDGKFSEETRESLIRLVAFLCKTYGLSEEDVIRHYDVSGKNCPKYYVENQEAWQALLEDIREALN